MAKGRSQKDILNDLRQQVSLTKEMEENSAKYVENISRLGALIKEINNQQKLLKLNEGEIEKTNRNIATQKEKIKRATGKQKKEEEKVLDELEAQLLNHQMVNTELKKRLEYYDEEQAELKQSIQSANKFKVAIDAGNKSLKASSKLIKQGLVKGFGMIKGSGLLDMTKEIRKAELSMGITTKHSADFSKTLQMAGKRSIQLGVNVGDLAKMQANYSDEVGRAVQLSDEGLNAMAEMAQGTTLGAEGAAQMAAQMENFNISAVGTRDIIEETVQAASDMGLNASKVVKNLQKNMKLAQTFHFKGGIRGLADMAKFATKMKVDMEGIAGMADQVFRPEGAVEMAAQLQTMGGAFAQMADPFQMMFKARNDFAGFTKDIASATKELVTFNKETGEAEIVGLQLDRMREISKITGINAEQLATMAKEGAKFDKIEAMLPPIMNDEDKELISSLAKTDGKGGFTVRVDGVETPVQKLTTEMKNQLKAQKLDLDERAKASQTFDESFNNLIMGLKQGFLPLVEQLNKFLVPKLQSWAESFGKKGGLVDLLRSVSNDIGANFTKVFDKFFGPDFIDDLTTVAKGIGKGVKFLANVLGENSGFVATGLKIMLGANLLMKGFSMFSGTVNLMRGIFSIFGGSIGKLGSIFGKAGGMSNIGKSASGFGRGLGRAGIAGAAGSLVSGGLDYARNNFMDDRQSGGGKSLGVLSEAAKWGGMGAAAGSIIPGVGTLVGGVVGGLGGAAYGAYNEFFSDTPQLAEGGRIKKAGMALVGERGPELLNLPGNAAVQPLEKSGTMEVKHSPININGTITLKTESGSVIDKNLLNNPHFIRELTRMIHEETSKAIGGGGIGAKNYT